MHVSCTLRCSVSIAVVAGGGGGEDGGSSNRDGRKRYGSRSSSSSSNGSGKSHTVALRSGGLLKNPEHVYLWLSLQYRLRLHEA